MGQRIKKRLLIPAAGLVFAASILAIGQHVMASGESVSANTTATTEVKTATTISGITINGTGNATVPVKLLVTSGTLSMTTTTGLTFEDANGNTVSNPQTGSTLYFSGARSDINAALATLKYTRTTTGSDTLEISLVNPGEVFFPGNGHLYEYVSSTLDWNSAKNAATARTKDGATGYLATITSQAENDFVSARLLNAGWMGASDSASEGTWKWVVGPESSTTFCIGNYPAGCSLQSGQYANWNGGEPNDSGGNEDCAQFLSGSSGKWNDLPCSGTTLPGYVVEYGAPGGLPTVSAANIAITTSDTVAPSVPGTPSTTTPTTNQKPAWTWTASSDSGTGLANPAYTVQWSQSASFSSGVSSATTNTASYTPSANLSDGQWYFRIKANDVAGNSSAYSANGSVVVDTTAPTAPDIGTTTINTRFTPSTLAWNPSTDSGAGLANPAYTVQWSQSSTFSSGVSSATTNTIFYQTTSLSEGTWYFRIKASDTLSHASAWSNTVTIVYDTTAPSAPGAPSTGSPTNNNKPTWTWSASSDSGSGLNNPAYTVEWSQSSSFSSGVSSATTNATSFTQPSNLTNGTWYFRVTAADQAGNSSAQSLAGSVTIDSTPPNITSVLAASTSNTSETITWTTDKAGSSQIAYGPTVAYGSSTSMTDTSPRVTSHSVVINGLVACTLYHYNVTSVDSLTNSTTSGDNSFITSGCAGDASVTAHSDTLVPISAGGSLALSSGNSTVHLDVPANFAAADADFQIKKLDAATAFNTIGTPGGLAAVGNVYDIRAMRDTVTAITSFNGEVTVTMSYTGDDLKLFLEHSLTIHRWDGGIGWQALHNCSVNTVARTVTCSTPGFSIFGLFGEHVAAAASTTASASAKPSAHTGSKRIALAAATSPGNTSMPTSDSVAPTSTTEETPSTVTTQTVPTPIKKITTVRDADSGKRQVWFGGAATLVILLVALWWFIAAKRRKHDKDTKK